MRRTRQSLIPRERCSMSGMIQQHYWTADLGMTVRPIVGVGSGRPLQHNFLQYSLRMLYSNLPVVPLTWALQSHPTLPSAADTASRRTTWAICQYRSFLRCGQYAVSDFHVFVGTHSDPSENYNNPIDTHDWLVIDPTRLNKIRDRPTSSEASS